MASATVDLDSGGKTQSKDSFQPPTRVSTATSTSVQSSEADTRGTGGKFWSKYRPGLRVTLDEDDLGHQQDRHGCFLEPLSEPKGAQFDLVFVHGLSGDHRTTWQCGDVFWPQDVAADLPNARVLLFGYKPQIWNDSGFEAARNTARDLVRLLAKSRVESLSGRPVIWIAHSLGGFLVKAACTLDHDGPSDSRFSDVRLGENIGDFTRGIIFMGTPHRALSLSGWPQILRRIYNTAEEYSEVAGLKQSFELAETSKLLQLFHDFEQSLSTSHAHIFSFYEQHETFGDSLPILVTSFENAMFHPSEIQDTLPGNHVTICRLQGRSDSGYLRMKKIVEDISEGFHQASVSFLAFKSVIPSSSLELNVYANFKDPLETIRPESSSHDEDDRRTLVPPSIISQFATTLKLRRLKRFLAYPNYHLSSSLVAKPAASIPRMESAAWAINTKEFQEWLESGHTLVLHGTLGSGKSELASRIVHYLEEHHATNPLDEGSRRYILSYFFDNLIESEYAVRQMLHQFLLQLLEISPSLVRHFPTTRIFSQPRASWPQWYGESRLQSSFKKVSLVPMLSGEYTESEFNHRQLVSRMFTMMELTEIVISILHDDQIDQVFFVIDGLDYSQRQCLSQFQYFLGLLNSLSPRNTKVCLTHHSKLDISLKHMAHLDIGQRFPHTGWKQLNPVGFLHPTLQDEFNQDESMRTLLQETLDMVLSQKRHSYLSNILIQRVLTGLRQLDLLREFLQHLKDSSLKHETVGEKDHINKIYKWILVRALPSTHNWLDLMGSLFLVALASRPLTVDEVIELLPTIRNAIASSNIYSIPSSQPDMELDFEQLPHASKLSQEIEADTHGLLNFDNGIFFVCHPSLKVFILEYLEQHELTSTLQYQIVLACLNLLDGLRAWTTNNNITYDSAIRTHSVPVDSYSYAFKYWSRHLMAAHDAPSWSSAQSRRVLSVLKHLWGNDRMRGLIHEFSQQSFPSNCDFTLSCLLAGYGLSKVLEVLLDSEPTTGTTDHLSLEQMCAAANSSETCIEVLRKHGHDDALRDANGHTVGEHRAWAASEKFKDTFFLPDWAHDIFRQVKIDSPTRCDETALWGEFYERIRSRENGELIEQLKSEGFLEQSLTLAVRRGGGSLTKTLLRNGADPDYIDVHDPQRPSVLHLAAATGDARLVEKLLAFGCRTSVTDRLGTRPIHWAAERGHFRVVQQLVSPSDDLEDRFGRNPLFMACYSASSETVRVLLKFGSNINLPDKARRTPLHAAASTGALDMVRLLLSRGADAGAQDKKGICALHVAAYGGWASVVEELLAWGVSADVRSNADQTALHFACKSLNPSLEVVSTLLQQQSDPNARDADNHTPLYIAVRSRAYAIVDLLLKATDYDPASLALRELAMKSNAAVLNLSKEHPPSRPAGSLINLEPIQSPADGPIVNVVFVHGFHRTQWDTWSHSSTFWPTVNLHADIGSARIICWDHHYESADFSKLEHTQRLARNLLEFVVARTGSSRSNTSPEKSISRSPGWFNAPIVFVGHSLGGLVIKLALDIASKDVDFASVFFNTRGVVLLGTPHYVADKELYLNVFSQLVLSATGQRLGASSWRPPRPLNKDGPPFAKEIHEHEALEKEFTRMCTTKEIPVLAIMESVSTHGLEPLVPSRVARYDLPFSRSQVSLRDHASLGQFLGPDDEIYKTIRLFIQEIAYMPGQLSRIVTEKIGQTAPVILKESDSSMIDPGNSSRTDQSRTQDMVLSKLRASVSTDDQSTNAKPDIVVSSLLPSLDTTSLDVKNPVTKWLQSKDNAFWISGKPGSGKSTLMRHIFHHDLTPYLLQKSFQVGEENLVLVAFYFARDKKHQQSAEDMLCTILYQILSTKSHLIFDVFDGMDEGISSSSDWNYRWEQLISAFNKAVRSNLSLKYAVFIDALDECQPSKEVDDPYRQVCEFVHGCQNHPNVKICISSRPLGILMHALDGIPRIYMHDFNNQDIESFVQTRLSEAGQRTGLDTSALGKTVIEKSQGVTLWAALTVDKLVRGIETGDSNAQLQEHLESTPMGLYEVYDRMWNALPHEYLREASKIFQLVLAAPRKLDLVLLSLAEEGYMEDSTSQEQAPKSNLRAINEELLPMIEINLEPQLTTTADRMKRRLKSRCADFLEVRQTGEVQFIHRSARAFISDMLQRNRDMREINTASFDPLLDLLSASTIRLKRFLPAGRNDSTARFASNYISDVLAIALVADKDANDRQSYVRLVDELSRTCLKLRRLCNSVVPESKGNARVDTDTFFQRVSQEQYSSLLAIRVGLWEYLLETIGQIGIQLKDSSERSLLLHAINRQDLKTLPWGNTMPENLDLPPETVVKSLLHKLCSPNERWHGLRDVWREVLEAGYHCFSDEWVPVQPGPAQTVHNCKRWVAIMELFLNAGANGRAQYTKVGFRRRDDPVKSGSPLGNIYHRTITPEKTLYDNLRCQRLYEAQFKVLLEAIGSRPNKSKMHTFAEALVSTGSPRQSIKERLSRSSTMPLDENNEEERETELKQWYGHIKQVIRTHSRDRKRK